MKYKILLLLSLFTFSAFPKAPRSTAPSKNSHPSLYSIAKKLQDEVVSLETEEQRLIDNENEFIPERNSLIDDIDEVLRKIDNGEITYRNDEINNIWDKINDLDHEFKEFYKSGKTAQNLNDRKLAVECKLEENPKLKNLIYMDRLYDKINEYNDLCDTNKWVIYNNKADTFISKAKNLPYYLTSEDSQELVPSEEEPMASEEKSPEGGK
ncbi:hypothetical protein [Candidatus Azobacteroides pseudotrichonymphae]|uniref:Uncharacterized protein n=1 Tax=Azobacteroides pseudotrichonymphae genomovar. CFP2 TaxID=511995 RepID=B6YS66_AZOPC|nr:hypothetical protein [Candidatus Azobacteroides pseudotrichonymphae]BAG84038.1 hypothetical protein CFPG_P1-17 [Candidatus Azobacteroides pseudotrichonymphae genomovar. CFP2]